MKIGDKVVMNNNYYVSEENKGRVWVVRSEPWNLLMATDIVIPERCFLPSSRSGENGYAKHDSRARSKTFPGIARAMAAQWAGKVSGYEGEGSRCLKS